MGQQKLKRPLDPEIVRRLIETRLQEEKFEAEKWNVPQLVYNKFETIDWNSDEDEYVETDWLEKISCKAMVDGVMVGRPCTPPRFRRIQKEKNRSEWI